MGLLGSKAVILRDRIRDRLIAFDKCDQKLVQADLKNRLNIQP